jgi:hypothetical protein
VYYDVFVCCGERVARTTGRDAGYSVGDHVAMVGTTMKGRFEWNKDELEFARSGVLLIEDIADYFPALRRTKETAA